eukprot:CAMPEP_0184472074 /NCGR_PEP_ID=MMETSP0740-20130409/107773_1 /TAXON_ID=385413 /ORGANISM="Thalassiosira miniscula, Strain CCMP1093" /LENGTH=107 /DNA_ID=CAMNT_0026848637 /DNA_START=91 /DNA_END=414 /DNA_ORIENTATION=+
MAPINTPDEILAVVDKPGAVLIDCRTEAEVKDTPLSSRPSHNVSCTIAEGGCDELVEKAPKLMPDKDAPVIIFCRSGRRAGKAKEVLEMQGYTTVLNAGGRNDLTYL